MKKLMIVLAAVALAAGVQASTVAWGLSGSLDTTQFASGTAYLICVDDIARPLTLTAETAAEWYSANKDSFASKALRTASVTDGEIYTTEVIESPVARKNYWLLIDNDAAVDADHYFAVSTINKSINIQAGTLNQTAAWIAGTQMTTFAVAPEPTSGLLMVLGHAGLALRRRRG